MSTILPEYARAMIRVFYRQRLFAALGFVFLASAVITFLLIVPSYVIAIAPLPQVDDGIASDAQSMAQELHRTDQVTTAVEAVATSTPVFDALVEALSLRPDSISITGVQYVRGMPDKKQIVPPSTLILSGKASGRQAIDAYIAALQKNSHFKSVSVPLGTLVGAEGGVVTITLTGSF